MKAVGLTLYLPIDNPESLLDIELPKPTATGRDLLVQINAIAVNPVDTKVRKPKDKVEETPRVLGWDAAGVVVEAGPDCTLFKVGDAVYYAGDVTRQGCNAEFQLIDERIVGHRPAKLSDNQAAALPLTAVTAWEALFHRLNIPENKITNQGKTLLVIGGAGGVGSIAIQLAKKVAGLTVIVTASRPESVEWVKSLGADVVVNHHGNLMQAMLAAGHPLVDYILCANDTDAYFGVMADLIKPQGMICSIVETAKPVNLDLLKTKSAGFVWEFMFTRSMYKTDDMDAQNRILDRVSELVDAGMVKTTLNQVLTPINAANLRQAHAQLESGTTIGKLVLSGW